MRPTKSSPKIFASVFLLALLFVMSLGLSGCSQGLSSQELPLASEIPELDKEEPGNDAAEELTPPGFEKFASQCGTVSGVAGDPGLFNNPNALLEYCVYANHPEPKKTIWFFHGLTDDENIFRNPGENRISYRKFLEQVEPVRIVAISFGTLWMFSSNNNRTEEPKEATIDVFRNKIVPYFVERFKLPQPWSVMGQSMGGFNAAILCAGAPELWKKCVLLNSMLPSCDPYTGAFPEGLTPVGGGFSGINMCNPGPAAMVKDQFTAAEYKDSQPLQVLARASNLPKTYVTACREDDFGLFTGPQAWAQVGQRKGWNVTWDPKSGSCDHFQWPVESVIEFLK